MTMRARWMSAIVIGVGLSAMVATAAAENRPVEPRPNPNLPPVHISGVVASMGPKAYVITPGGMNYGVELENPSAAGVTRSLRFHSYGQSEIPNGPFEISPTSAQSKFMRVVYDPHGIENLCSPYPQKVEFMLFDGTTQTQTALAQVQAKECVFDVSIRNWWGGGSADTQHTNRTAGLKGKVGTIGGSITQAASCALDGKLKFDVYSDLPAGRTVMVELVRGTGEIVSSRQITIEPKQTKVVELDLLRAAFATNGPQNYRVRIENNDWSPVDVTRTCRIVSPI